jgi:heme/copper-type cytochrome/quinol oxidase subunit 3
MTTHTAETSRPIIDVSKLPSSAMDSRSPIWWGNALLLCIETSMFMIVIASYIYFRRNFAQWPPPKIDQLPVLYHPVPKLLWATIDLVLMLVSVVPMVIAERACLKMDAKMVKLGAGIALLIGLICIVLRFVEMRTSLIFRWNDNVYGSITWTILGVHLMHLIILSCEDGLMFAWILIKGLDDKHARDIRVTAVYWYWVVAMWVILYVVIFWSPRFL